MTAIVDGFRYVAARKPLRRVVIASTVVIMFGFNYIAFMPALVEGEFGLGDGAVGLMSTASSIGAVMVSIPVAARASSPRVRIYTVGLGLAFGATVMALSSAPNYAIAFVITIFIGAGATGFQTLANSIVVTSSDASHHGRVQSLMQLSFAGFGIVALPLGATAEWVGLRPTIVIMGGVALVATLVFAVLGAGLGGFQMSAQNLVLEFGSRRNLPMRIAVANSASELVAAVGALLGAALTVVVSFAVIFQIALAFQAAALVVVGLWVDEPRTRRR